MPDCSLVYFIAFRPRFDRLSDLEIEELFEDAHGVFWTSDRVANGALISVDLVVVTTLEGLVAEEVNVLVGNAALSGLVLEVLKAVGLIPASGEDIEGDLAAN